jgi:putative hydrolase of the HAD superfamily
MTKSPELAAQVAEVMTLFECVVESSKEGIRKPNPRIYELACEKLEIVPDQAVYLDDLGINLKPAKAMGMQTIKVVSEAQAIAELGEILDIEF